jgi:hypothetical protein
MRPEDERQGAGLARGERTGEFEIDALGVVRHGDGGVILPGGGDDEIGGVERDATHVRVQRFDRVVDPPFDHRAGGVETDVETDVPGADGEGPAARRGGGGLLEGQRRHGEGGFTHGGTLPRAGGRCQPPGRQRYRPVAAAGVLLPKGCRSTAAPPHGEPSRRLARPLLVRRRSIPLPGDCAWTSRKSV